MKPPCRSGKGLRGFTVTTGSRHEKSTPVTGRSPAGVGPETGDEATCAVAGTVGWGGLTAAVGWDWLQAISKIPTRQRRELSRADLRPPIPPPTRNPPLLRLVSHDPQTRRRRTQSGRGRAKRRPYSARKSAPRPEATRRLAPRPSVPRPRAPRQPA